MIDNEVTNFREKKITEIDHQIGPVDWNVLSGQFDRLFGKDWPKEISGQGTQGLTQNIFSMPGLTPENLLKFIFTTTFVGPKIDLGLQGIDITGAIFDALPGFIGELWGNWLPAGL